MKLSIFIVASIGLVLNSCRKDPEFSAATFPIEKGWGYSISIDGKKVIQQTVIPTLPGNHPFFSKKDASKTANCVLRKLKHFGNPTLTKEDLDSLQIQFPHE